MNVSGVASGGFDVVGADDVRDRLIDHHRVGGADGRPAVARRIPDDADAWLTDCCCCGRCCRGPPLPTRTSESVAASNTTKRSVALGRRDVES